MKPIILIGIVLASATAQAATVKVKPENSTVTFEANATPGFLRINGEGGHVEGTVDDDGTRASGTLTVKLTDVTTGVGMRDEHMKEKYLETAKYPVATLKLSPVVYGEKSFDWTGDLTIKDQTKPVHGTATVTKEGAGKKVKATFKLSLKDYPHVGSPSWKAIQVGDEVTVNVEVSI